MVLIYERLRLVRSTVYSMVCLHILKDMFLSPTDVADTEFLLAWLGRRGTLVRTRGKDASKIYARTHAPMVCECGCKINRGLIYKHRKTKKHARLMAEKASPSIGS